MSELGVRQLAAIVFTDVVGFSAQVGAREEETLKLVHRDAAKIQQLAEAHNGRVLKSTGDGQLMYFGSATDAVRCALELQKMVAAHEEPLQYRIGIHLGDVFMKAGDVMGDGVNIAARLQAEAQPGGICLSQTVYDVVKNRIAVEATFIGARELKNIRDAVPVYQILLDAHVRNSETPPTPQKPAKQSKTVLMTTAAIVGVLALTILVALVWRGDRAIAPMLASSQPSASTTPEWSGSSEREAGMDGERRDIRKLREEREERIERFVQARLRQYSKENPLHLLTPTLPNEQGKREMESSAWMQGNRLFIERPEGVHDQPLAGADPKLILLIARSLAEASDADDAEAREFRETFKEVRPKFRPGLREKH